MMTSKLESLQQAVIKLQQKSAECVELYNVIQYATNSIHDSITTKEAEYKKLQEKLEKVSIHAPKAKIKLNVGGVVFGTSVQTLTNEKDTFFSAMFSEQFNQQPDEDGEYFIDRDPTHFSIILNHFRGVDIQPIVNELSNGAKKLLETEVDFYQIASLKEILCSSTKQITPIQWYHSSTKAIGSRTEWHLFKSQSVYVSPFECKIKVTHINTNDSNSWKICLGIIDSNDTQHKEASDWVGKFATGYAYIATGKKCQASSSGTPYGVSYSVGDVITIRVQDGSVSFDVNGTGQGIAFHRLNSSQGFYIAASLSSTLHSVEFVS